MEYNEMTFKEVLEHAIEAHKSERLKNRIIADLDLKIIDCDEEKREWADYYYEAQEKYYNPYDGIHGGVACVIADTCMGQTIAAATQTLPSTTDMSISYHRPMNGRAYRIHVELKKTGKQLVSTGCEVFDYDTGKLCVSLMAKYIFVKKSLVGEEEAARLLK